MSDSSLPGSWERFFAELTSFLNSCERQHGLANEEFTEYVIENLSLSCQSVQALHARIREVASAGDLGREIGALRGLESKVKQLLEDLQYILQEWRDYSDTIIFQEAATSYVAPLRAAPLSGRGRPRFDISRDQIHYLRSLSFSWTAIAEMLVVSRMTMYRRRVEFGMLDEPHSSISDDQLHAHVLQIIREHPQVGQSFILGRLRSLGYRVTRERVRQAVRTCDPLNTALRWQGSVAHRRPYSVPGPNSLWHIGMSTLYIPV